MTNEILKQVFQEMHSEIDTRFRPNSTTSVLFSKNVINYEDYDILQYVPAPADRCRKLLSMLHRSSHPQAFIHLRLALLDEDSWIVDKIDKRLTSELQQLRLSGSSNGKRVLLAY